MSRAQVNDPLQSFRFHVAATDLEDAISFAGGIEGAEAGFQSVTIPEISVEMTEYREGTMRFTKKFPGIPTVTDMTLMRGMMKTDTVFHDWVMKAATTGEYRTELIVWIYHRSDDTSAVESPTASFESGRAIKCKECAPLRSKPAGDLDATSGEVSLLEMDVAMEYFEIVAE